MRNFSNRRVLKKPFGMDVKSPFTTSKIVLRDIRSVGAIMMPHKVTYNISTSKKSASRKRKKKLKKRGASVICVALSQIKPKANM